MFILIGTNISQANEYIFEFASKFTTEKIIFPDTTEYVQIKGEGSWQDNLGDYGKVFCLGKAEIQDKIANLNAFCEAKNQNNVRFWIALKRSSEMQAGVGIVQFIAGELKYENLVGIQCPYAIQYYEDMSFFKQKCRLEDNVFNKL
tara:strand:+ start:33 stop:470 length:438 start_codon:yes stop_codon:yes gene_type:complete